MMDIPKILEHFAPSRIWNMKGETYSSLEFLDDLEHISEIQLRKWSKKMPDVAYKEQRRREYPPIGDQLDMLWHAMNTGRINRVTDFYDSIKAVKDKYPKGKQR